MSTYPPQSLATHTHKKKYFKILIKNQLFLLGHEGERGEEWEDWSCSSPGRQQNCPRSFCVPHGTSHWHARIRRGDGMFLPVLHTGLPLKEGHPGVRWLLRREPKYGVQGEPSFRLSRGRDPASLLCLQTPLQDSQHKMPPSFPHPQTSPVSVVSAKLWGFTFSPPLAMHSWWIKTSQNFCSWEEKALSINTRLC